VRLLKQLIEKDTLVSLVGGDTRAFLDRIDRLGDRTLSLGKWNKLYALCAEARKITGESYYVYSSPNLNDYDTSTHIMYSHLFDGRVQLWHSIHPDPKR
jgi:hypothetical protein